MHAFDIQLVTELLVFNVIIDCVTFWGINKGSGNLDTIFSLNELNWLLLTDKSRLSAAQQLNCLFTPPSLECQ
jgi:hypothetical protein